MHQNIINHYSPHSPLAFRDVVNRTEQSQPVKLTRATQQPTTFPLFANASIKIIHIVGLSMQPLEVETRIKIPFQRNLLGRIKNKETCSWKVILKEIVRVSITISLVANDMVGDILDRWLSGMGEGKICHRNRKLTKLILQASKQNRIGTVVKLMTSTGKRAKEYVTFFANWSKGGQVRHILHQDDYANWNWSKGGRIKMSVDAPICFLHSQLLANRGGMNVRPQ
eukprot:scaffold248498_cov65-Cyclotella_meneghiniana.AAC.2